ncbi:MAG TPA: glycosyltransferase family 39 protein [Firmicutes bacterium]|nr:glycosyltransferase family 39 protein [Bacillota bacterium]
MGSQSDLVPIVVIAVLVLPALLIGLGASSLWDLDEGMYAEVAREMLVRGDYVAPYFNYQPRFDKPPLHYWVTAGFYKVFGVNEFSARLGSASFGFLGAVLVYFLGRTLFSKRVGLLAAIVLGTNLLYFAESKIGLVDTALTFFIVLSLLAFWLAWLRRDRRYYALLGVAMALGTLTKGPVAVLLPGGVIIIFLVLSEGFRGVWREVANRWALLGAATFALIALPWHLAVWARYGGKFLADYFGYHMFTRFTSAIETHGGPWYYYLLVLALGFLPWSGFLLAGAVGEIIMGMRVKPWMQWLQGGHDGRRDRRNRDRFYRLWGNGRDGVRFVMIWFAVVFLFFSMSKTKLPGYILPGLPSVALAVALWLDGIFVDETSARARRAVVAGLSLIGALGMLLGLLLLAAGPNIPPEYAGVARLLFFFPVAVVAGTVITITLFMLTHRAGIAFLATVTMFLLVAVGLNIIILPRLELYKPVKPLALEAGYLLESGGPGRGAGLSGGGELGSMLAGGGDASSVFYARRPVRYILSEDEAIIFLRQNQPALLMIPERAYKSLVGKLAASEPSPGPVAGGDGPAAGLKLYILKKAAGALLISNTKLD